MKEISQHYLKSILSYSPESGEFRWLTDLSCKPLKGKIAGTDCNGYIVIRINKKGYKAHRLAWLYMTGKFPEKIIDHIDRNPKNNSWDNLRDCSYRENSINCSRISKYPGVHKNSYDDKYKVSISINNKRRYVGCFKTMLAANYAYHYHCVSELSS